MQSQHDGSIELSLEVAGLKVTISGPSALAAEFVCFVSDFRPARPASPTSSIGSFTRVSVVSAPDSRGAAQVPARETRDQIAASFAPCPPVLRALGSRLQGTDTWTAGQWAKAVLEERVHSPNRTPPLDLRSRYYAVARCVGLDSPTIYKSSASYWRQLGTLEGSSSISQSFPSETEALVYLQAAGFSEQEIQVLP